MKTVTIAVLSVLLIVGIAIIVGVSLEPVVKEPPKPVVPPEVRYFIVEDKEEYVTLMPQVIMVGKTPVTIYHPIRHHHLILNDTSTLDESSLYHLVKIGDKLKATITTGWLGIKIWNWSIVSKGGFFWLP